MGLAERRLAEKIKTEQVPAFQGELQAAMGFAPDLEIDWDTFLAYDEYPLNRMQGQLLEPLVEAMKNIGQDAMGKQALQDSIAKVVLKNGATGDEAGVSLRDKTLYLTASLGDGVYYSYGASDIVKYLEPML